MCCERLDVGLSQVQVYKILFSGDMIPVIHFQCRFMGFLHLVYLSDRQTTTSGYGTCANLRGIDFIFVLLSLWDKLAKMSYKKWLRIEVSLEKV